MSFPTFSFSTTAEEVATAFADVIRGKNILMTGTSPNGIGFETARVLAKYAHLVIVTGHNAARLQVVVETIKKESPSANLRPLVVDLSSLAAVRKAAAEVNAYTEPLHVLIHNAAAPIAQFRLSVDGLDYQLATDHFGPFLLTKLLTPKILTSGTETYTPRVVFVASIGHGLRVAGLPGVDFKTLGHPDPSTYVPFDTYCQAKATNVLKAKELSKRSKGRVNSYSLHPGFIYTNIMQHNDAVAPLQELGCLDAQGMPTEKHFAFKTMAQGAATTLVAAFDPRLDDKPGAYLDDCVDAPERLSAWCADPVNAETLWNLTEEILGETFVF